MELGMCIHLTKCIYEDIATLSNASIYCRLCWLLSCKSILNISCFKSFIAIHVFHALLHFMSNDMAVRSIVERIVSMLKVGRSRGTSSVALSAESTDIIDEKRLDETGTRDCRGVNSNATPAVHDKKIHIMLVTITLALTMVLVMQNSINVADVFQSQVDTQHSINQVSTLPEMMRSSLLIFT